MKLKTYWVVCHPTEEDNLAEINTNTMFTEREHSINKFITYWDDYFTWAYLYSHGWRCVKVTLNQVG